MDNTRAIKDYFNKEKSVLCVYLFGSQATRKANKFSGVDIAVLFDDTVSPGQYTSKSLAIMDELSSILDRDIDVIVLNKANSFLRFQIIKNGMRIYERQDRTGRDFEARAIVDYFDFLPIRKRLETAFINSIRASQK